MSNLSKVVNVKKDNLVKLGYKDLEDRLKDPNHIYIGRNMTFYVSGSEKSKWCNPFPVKKHGLEKCLELYREYITNDKELLSQIDELKGKTLGCWCNSSEKCHGGILIELLQKQKN